MKLFVKISSVIVAGIGLLLLFCPIDWFYRGTDVRYIGGALLVESVLIFCLPRLIKKKHAREAFQFLLVIIFLVNAIGDLGLYRLQYFDKLLHFSFPVIAAVVFNIVIGESFNFSRFATLALSFFLVIIFGILWEVFENGADYFLGTSLAGLSGHDIFNDTIYDLICDVAGASFGTLINLTWQEKVV